MESVGVELSRENQENVLNNSPGTSAIVCSVYWQWIPIKMRRVWVEIIPIFQWTNWVARKCAENFQLVSVPGPEDEARPWPVSVCTMICDSVLRGCCPNRREFIVDAETWFVTVIGFIRPGELFYAMNNHPNSHQWPRSWKLIMYLSEEAHQLMEWNCWQMLLQGIWSGGGFAGSRRIILLFSLKRRIDWWL